jgi:hypothetical protein
MGFDDQIEIQELLHLPALSGPWVVPPGHGDPEVRPDRGRRDERPGLRAQLNAELNTDLIGRIIGAPETGKKAIGGRDNRCGGFLERLICPLPDGWTILPQAAHHRAGRCLIDLNENTAALLKRELNEALHWIPA